MQLTSLSPFGVSPAEASIDHSAPWSKVDFSPPPAWVELGTEDYSNDLGVREGDHVTHLLMSRQVQARTGAVYEANAVRLETNFAVQHETKWSVPLDPHTQTLTLHWIRVVRDGKRIDHLDRDHIRLVQRETQPEQILMNGNWTLLVVLEDLRVGDIIETAFTYKTTDLIRPHATELFFAVPPQAVIGRYRLSVLSDVTAARLLWKASTDAPKFREEKTSENGRRWIWDGKQLDPRKIEFNQPPSSLDYVWIQVSDLSSWAELSGRIATAWGVQEDAAGIDGVSAFVRPLEITASAITRLIQYIQDEFRCVTLGVSLSGRSPASPSVVARRRYGDGKDLVWLTVAVLRRWGVEARPVLVHSTLQDQVVALLPSMRSFNHAVVEVTLSGTQRWFDLATRSQGGDFKTQAVTWFGYGLPIDATSPSLRAQSGERSGGSLIFIETVLLESRLGEASVAEHHIWAEGTEADRLRQQYTALGFDEFARVQEQNARRRYNKATRAAELQWRDNREQNTCELVEVFSLYDAVIADPIGRRGFFEVPPNLIAQAFPLPGPEPRRTAWALPYPLELRHEIIVKNSGMPHGSRRRRRWTGEGFSASLDEPKLRGAWSKVVHFAVTAPEVSAGQIEAYRKQLGGFQAESLWRLYLPWNLLRGNRGPGFGELLPLGQKASVYVPPTLADEVVVSPDLSGIPGALSEGRDGIQAISRPPETEVLDPEEMKRGGVSRRPHPVIARPKTEVKLSTMAWVGLWLAMFLGMLYLLHTYVEAGHL